MKRCFTISVFLFVLLLGIISCKKEEHHWEVIKDTPTHNWGNNDTTSTSGNSDTTSTSGNNDTTSTSGNDTTTVESVADSIYYEDIADIEIHSVNYFYNAPFSPCTSPVPQDSDLVVSIPFGPGLAKSMGFRVNHGIFQQGGSSCTSFSYIVSCSLNSYYDSVVVLPSYGQMDSLLYGRVIDNNCLYRSGGSTIKGPYFSFKLNKDYYLGVKINLTDGAHYAWFRVSLLNNNGIVIKDYAINLTPGNDIFAGQTQ